MACTAMAPAGLTLSNRRPFVVSSSRNVPARIGARQLVGAWRAAAQQPSRRSLFCRAADGGSSPEEPRQQAEAAAPASSSAPEAAAPERRPVAVDPSVAKGQRTAIVTGAISIIFGVIYLALAWFMDMRGGEMLPPPPEAFEYM